MKRIALIVLTLVFCLSLFLVFSSCGKNDDNNKDGDGPAVSNPSNKPSEENKDPDPGIDDPIVSPPASSNLIGIVGELDAYKPDEDKSYVRVDVQQFTDTTVYLMSKQPISGITARFYNPINDATIKVELSEWTFDEARGIYYATFNAPNVAGNAVYQLYTSINGTDNERVYAVQVLKKMNVDPNGWV